MAYSLNPYLPKVRIKAVEMLRSGKAQTEVARHFGVSQSAISKWNNKVPVAGFHFIPTQSSRPKTHPRSLRKDIVEAIVKQRKKNGRCAEVVHAELKKEGIIVSLSSVKRTLDRKMLTKKRSPYKRYHKSIERPYVRFPGDLVQIDTIPLDARHKETYLRVHFT